MPFGKRAGSKILNRWLVPKNYSILIDKWKAYKTLTGI